MRVLRRLRVVDWEDDASAWAHAPSRALLMREYLRRAALWAKALGAEAAWPFLDVAEHIEEVTQVPSDVAAELEEFLKGLAPEAVRITCRAAVRWAAVAEGASLPRDLQDPYEPLLLMYERGGGYYLEEYVDLNGVMIRLGNVEVNAAATPFLALAPATLDALDAEGETEYYAKISEGYPPERPRGIVRRRTDDEGAVHDEAFTRNLRWEPTDYLKLHALGHNDIDHVRITAIQAAEFIQSTTEKLTGSR